MAIKSQYSFIFCKSAISSSFFVLAAYPTLDPAIAPVIAPPPNAAAAAAAIRACLPVDALCGSLKRSAVVRNEYPWLFDCSIKLGIKSVKFIYSKPLNGHDARIVVFNRLASSCRYPLWQVTPRSWGARQPYKNLFRCHDDVILFTFAEQDMFAVKQVARGYSTGGAGFTNVLNVNPAAFNVLARVALGRTKADMNQ